MENGEKHEVRLRLLGENLPDALTDSSCLVPCSCAQVDGAQEKEKRARDTITRLKSEIQNLSRLVDQGAGLSIGQENAVNDLLKLKEELTAEVESQQAAIALNQTRIAELERLKSEADERRLAGEREILALKERLAKSKSEAARELRRADRLQQELITIKEVNDARKAELGDQKGRMDDLAEKVLSLDQNLRAAQAELDSKSNLADELAVKNSELQKSIELHLSRQNELLAEREQAQSDSAGLQKELRKKNAEIASLTKRREKIEKERDQIQLLRLEAERYRNWLKDEMKSVLKAVEAQRRDGDLDEKLIRELQNQVKRLTATLHVAQEKNSLQFKLVSDHEALQGTMADDILQHKLSEQELRKKNYKLEKEREKERSEARREQDRRAHVCVSVTGLDVDFCFCGFFLFSPSLQSQVQPMATQIHRSSRILEAQGNGELRAVQMSPG
jgi:chromosome segregation ATPase